MKTHLFPFAKTLVLPLVVIGGWVLSAFSAEPRALFDGKTFAGWEGDTAKIWRIEEGAITAGTADSMPPHNEFLCTTQEFENFELRLKFKITGTTGFVNGGIQFRSQRVPNNYEVSGYQADIGTGYYGALYDESRRNKILAQPTPEIVAKALKKDDWNDYRIRADGAHIQIWLNEVLTVDYLEADANLPTKGILGLQIHGGGKTVMRYKELVLAELPKVDVDDPAVERASFKVADGFEVSLFASEKEGVVKPIQMRFDPRGRLWVIGSTIYPQIEPGQTPNDKVLVLEDTQGKGRCDKVTVFAEGLMMPTGIELGDGGAYVGHGTQLLFLKDTNGDGKADERRVVLRGFGTGDTHQNINSFLFGPGGELWMCQGLHNFSHVETPWGISKLEQAGIWRFQPQRMQLEGFYGSANEPQNPWGFVFTDWGEPIELAANNSSPIYPVPGLVANHREAAPTILWKNGNGRKCSGGDLVGTTHFPDAWQGALLLGGYINNAIWTLKISDDGAGFSLTDLPPLITSSSPSFRPVDVKFGPDGALYICDWYNPIIGHYQASFRDPRRDKAHGRIWRVTAKGRPLTKPPQLAGVPLPQLLDNLKSPDRWTRQFSKRALADLPADKVTAALKKWITQSNLSDHDLMEALGVYQSHEVVEPQLLARLARAKEAGARAYAASVAGSWADRLENPLALLRPLVADENARVRLQAVIACTHVQKPEAIETATIAADFPTDKFLDYGLNQAVYALKPQWLPALKTGQLKFEGKSSRLSLLLRADGTPDTLQALRTLISSPQLDAPARETFLRLLAEVGDANDLATILKLDDVALQARVLPALATATRVRRVRPAGDLTAMLTPLVENNNAKLSGEALKLAGLWKLETFRAVTEKRALSESAVDWINRDAIEAVANFGGDLSVSFLQDLATKKLSGRIRADAVASLATLDPVVAAPLAADWLAHAADKDDPTELFSAFFQKIGGAEVLARALQAKPPAKDAAKIGLRLMSASGRRNESLAAILTTAAGFSGEPKRLTTEETKALVAEVRSQGRATRGEEIFRRPELGCIACHTINGKGGTVGPNLSALGTAQPVDFIIGAILDPQKEVKEGFISYEVTTKDGDEYQGYIVRETAEELILRDALQQRDIRLRRDQIKGKKQHGSLMPNGLADLLTRTEFLDLVRYLSEQGKP